MWLFLLGLSSLLCSFAGSALAEKALPIKNAPPKVIGEAVLEAKSGSKVGGKIVFIRSATGLKLEAKLTGVAPGEHGLHVHEKGDCSAPDAMSAGGHFNPSKVDHGAPGAVKRHAGDFGNITIDAKGNGSLELIVENPAGFKDWQDLIGKSVIVHEKADDLKSQPVGAAGARIACGLITAS